MTLFTKVEDAQVVILDGAYEKQTDVYEKNGYLYACVGKNKFLRLYGDRRTLNPKIKVQELHVDCVLYQDALGRLGTIALRDRRELTHANAQKLLGGPDNG